MNFQFHSKKNYITNIIVFKFFRKLIRKKYIFRLATEKSVHSTLLKKNRSLDHFKHIKKSLITNVHKVSNELLGGV